MRTCTAGLAALGFGFCAAQRCMCLQAALPPIYTHDSGCTAW